MKTFIGRDRELAALERAWTSAGGELVPVYGRRRVGKSELILRFLRHKPGVYLQGKRARSAFQIREFLKEAAVALDEPLLAEYAAGGWKDALEQTTLRWRGPKKLTLAFDEFQWLVEASPELPSILQELWDRRWKAEGRVMTILCGSYIGFMEREILGEKSPLFGCRTAQILLQPFEYRAAAKFHPSYSLVDQAKTFFICGGIPLYLNLFAPDCSVDTNIVRQLMDEYAPLYREPDFLLREELREVDVYYAILMALSSGALPVVEIGRRVGVGERSLHYYLQQLMTLGYIARHYPLTGSRPSPRHVRYALEDPLLRFWFRFVYPNTSFIAQRTPVEAFRERIRPDLDAYWGSCFERLCRAALPFLYARERVTAHYEIGDYWDKQTQIDVVGYRNDGWTDLGECKWGTIKSVAAVRRDLEIKTGHYPNPRNATILKRIFAAKRPVSGGDEEAGFRWHSLEDLYRD